MIKTGGNGTIYMLPLMGVKVPFAPQLFKELEHLALENGWCEHCVLNFWKGTLGLVYIIKSWYVAQFELISAQLPGSLRSLRKPKLLLGSSWNSYFSRKGCGLKNDWSHRTQQEQWRRDRLHSYTGLNFFTFW